MSKMTMRERMLAVIHGKELDKVPFIHYNHNAAPNEEIWSAIGRDNMGILRGTLIHKYDHPNCKFVVEKIERDGLKGERTTLHTPKGQLVEEKFFEPTYGSGSISKHFIEQPEDYEVFLSYLRDVTPYEYLPYYYNTENEVKDDGITLVAVDRSPYQQLWIQWVSLLDLGWHLVECPDIVEECISRLIELERKQFDIVLKATEKVSIPLVEFCDNLTAPVIGEHYFRKYNLPLYKELSDMMAEKNIPVGVHADGDLKPLWNALSESGLRYLESFSPPPDNDTSVKQAFSMWPDNYLFVNFPSSIHLAEPEVIYQRAMEILEEGGHTGKMWIQISESVPPGVWKKSFPPILKAIADFGAPRK